MINNYIAVLKKYAVFSGRASRREYWYFFLANMIIGAVSGLIIAMMSSTSESMLIGFLVVMPVALAIIIPGIAVTVRRLHDTNRSGWWFFINFVPYIGGIILLVLTVLESTPGDNKYGPNPN